MKIWLTRHGQTNLNKNELMQGRTDEPLNEKGVEQAKATRKKVGEVKFDAVISSPLIRAVKTASIVGNIDEKKIIREPRIIEVDFGKFERCKYSDMGFWMTAYWALPEVIPPPATVENIASMVERSSSFLREIEQKDYKNVLVVCHSGIIRALCGFLEDRKNGIKWRPKPRNCEVRIYESLNGKHRYIKNIL